MAPIAHIFHNCPKFTNLKNLPNICQNDPKNLNCAKLPKLRKLPEWLQIAPKVPKCPKTTPNLQKSPQIAQHYSKLPRVAKITFNVQNCPQFAKMTRMLLDIFLQFGNLSEFFSRLQAPKIQMSTKPKNDDSLKHLLFTAVWMPLQPVFAVWNSLRRFLAIWKPFQQFQDIFNHLEACLTTCGDLEAFPTISGHLEASGEQCFQALKIQLLFEASPVISGLLEAFPTIFSIWKLLRIFLAISKLPGKHCCRIQKIQVSTGPDKRVISFYTNLHFPIISSFRRVPPPLWGHLEASQPFLAIWKLLVGGPAEHFWAFRSPLRPGPERSVISFQSNTRFPIV